MSGAQWLGGWLNRDPSRCDPTWVIGEGNVLKAARDKFDDDICSATLQQKGDWQSGHAGLRSALRTYVSEEAYDRCSPHFMRSSPGMVSKTACQSSAVVRTSCSSSSCFACAIWHAPTRATSNCSCGSWRVAGEARRCVEPDQRLGGQGARWRISRSVCGALGSARLFNRLKYSEFARIGTRVPIFLKAVFDVLPGIRVVLLDTRLPHNPSRERKHNYFKRLTQNNDIVCFQEIHGKDEFLQAIQVLAPRFRQYGTFTPNNANAGGSAVCIHKDLLPDEALVTCQGRDRIVSVRSGCRSPVVVNVPL